MKRDLPFLRHILDEINFLLNETKGFEYEDFFSNELLKKGCARSFEIIGEAAKNLSDEFKQKYKEMEWKKIAGMRDKIIHFYFGVNYSILWQTIKVKLPSLKEKIENIVENLEK
ncbi:MAG: DUF86 domain-containing protein [Elusimicrobia bacterium]|nr:DUF86 domain-containing protein [Elusimicrobiota bacterium]